MKKAVKMLLAIALAAGVTTVGSVPIATTTAVAATTAKTFGYSDPKAGRTYVPIRVLSDFSGAKVKWTAASGKIDIVKGKKKITLTMGKKQATIDGKTVQIDAVPFSDGGVTYVPLGLVATHLGLGLKWDSSISSMHVTSGEQKMDLPIIARGSLTNTPVRHHRQTFRVGGSSFTANVVTVQLMHPRVSLDAAFANHKVGAVQDLSAIAAQNGAYVAINGTFFDAYSSAAYKAPYGYLVSKGDVQFANGGTNRTIFAYDDNQLARLIPGFEFGTAFDAGQVEGAVQAGPMLLKNGNVAVNAAAEGFQDPKILTGGGARSAIGITQNHELILLTVGGSTIPQLAQIMKQAGAYQAMNLDGGASSGLYLNGKYITTPGRKVSNALLVKVSK